MTKLYAFLATGFFSVSVAFGQIRIGGYMPNPAGTDSPHEYVRLVATQNIDFTTTPYCVVFANNGTATASGWVASGNITYGFNLTSGSVSNGQSFYVGGSSKLINGAGSTDISSESWIRSIDTGTTAGDGLGSASSAGVLGNGGANADGIAVFSGTTSSLTNSTVPIDAVFFGTGIGTALVSGGSAGYQLPNNDRYSGGKLQVTSYLFPEPASGAYYLLTGNPRTATAVPNPTTINQLPVTYLNFTARLTELKQARINWATSFEQTNAYFAVERSRDLETYTELGRVVGKGTSQVRQEYGFTDEAPLAGTNYYRLKQVDADGRVSYNRPVAVLNEASPDPQVVVYPNPMASEVRLKLKQPVQAATAIDGRGRRQRLDVSDESIDVGALASGVYVLEVQTADGQTVRQRIVKE